MKLFEYQGKELFTEKGIRVPQSVLLDEADSIEKIELPFGFPCLVKAQVLQGGRGKAGLVKMVQTREELLVTAENYRNRKVSKILLEEAVPYTKELYLSITVDPLNGKAMVIASAEGGMEIEELAKVRPQAIAKESFDSRFGLQPFLARDIGFRLDGKHGKKIASAILSMYEVFTSMDAELVEINPLFITGAGDVIAGDAKVSIDDNAAFRQTRYTPGREYYDSEAEYEAAEEGIPYLQFDGDISLMCAGAGLTTTVFDLINYEGGSVANYLEFGGPNYRKAQRAMELCLKNESKVILIVTFGTIARADVMAEGVVNAINTLHPDRPIVVCIRGTNEEEAEKILKNAGLEPLFDTEKAVKKAIELCRREDHEHIH